MTKAEREYVGRVAALGCLVCDALGYGQTPAEVHHVREGQGASQRASNWLAVPLCPEHHRGSRGLHGDRSDLRMVKMDEMDLLAETIRRLNAGH